jgi:hypothetical protein
MSDQRGADGAGLRVTSDQVGKVLRSWGEESWSHIGDICRDWLDMLAVVQAARAWLDANDREDVDEAIYKFNLEDALDELTTPARDETAVDG